MISQFLHEVFNRLSWGRMRVAEILDGADKSWKTNLVPKMKRTKKLFIITTAYCSNNSLHSWRWQDHRDCQPKLKCLSLQTRGLL